MVLLGLHGQCCPGLYQVCVCVCVVGSSGMSLCGHYHVVCVLLFHNLLKHTLMAGVCVASNQCVSWCCSTGSSAHIETS